MLDMFVWILVVSSLGLTARSMSLQKSLKRLEDTLELKEMKIQKLTKQLELFGGPGEV